MSASSARGWGVVAGATLGLAVSTGPLLIFTFGVLAKPLAEHFHASRGTIALAVALLDLVVLFVAPIHGTLVDRFGARRVIATGAIGLAACLLAMATMDPPLWHIFVLYALAGAIGGATTPVTYARAVSSWFDRRRGLALGIAGAGIGAGAFLTPPLATYLVEHGSFRRAYAGLAIVSLAVVIPVVAPLLRRHPGERARVAASAPRDHAVDVSVRDAVATRTFWLMFAVFFVVAATVNGAFAHLVPLSSPTRAYEGKRRR